MKPFFSQSMTLANCFFFFFLLVKVYFCLKRQIYREKKRQRKVFLLTACMFIWVFHVGAGPKAVLEPLAVASQLVLWGQLGLEQTHSSVRCGCSADSCVNGCPKFLFSFSVCLMERQIYREGATELFCPLVYSSLGPSVASAESIQSRSFRVSLVGISAEAGTCQEVRTRKGCSQRQEAAGDTVHCL